MDETRAAEALLRAGRLDEAEQACRAALVGGESATILHVLGTVLLRSGKRAEAAAAYTRATEVDPTLSKSHNNLGNLRLEAGEVDEAIACYERALSGAEPTVAMRANLARALLRAGRSSEALKEFEIVLQTDAADPRVLLGHAQALRLEGRAEDALAELLASAERFSGDPLIDAETGAALLDLGRAAEARPYLERAHARLTQDEGVAVNLGVALLDAGELTRARELVEGASRRAGHRADVATALAEILFELSEHRRAIAALETAEEAAPADARIRLGSARLFHLDHVAEDADEILREHLRWGASVTRAHGLDVPLRPRARPSRPKLGFVSPDLRQHVLPRFLVGLLTALSERAEIVLLSTARRPDSMTAALARSFRVVDLGNTSRDDYRRSVQREQLDVVIELAGHTGDDLIRLSPRVAPLQVLYLGYPGTSGLPAFDLRITDRWVDPPGQDDAYGERPLRLDRTCWAYAPPSYFPPAAPARRGPPVFGCFSRLSKYGPRQVATFAAVLREVPESSLVLRARPFQDAAVRQGLLERFEAAGISPGRVTLRPWTGDLADAQAAYADVDVVLDTFPYHGTTTTCDALLAGRPVVSRRGSAPAARVASSLLAAVGREELVAADERGYVELAAALVTDTRRRDVFAEELPRAMREGPLGDPRDLGRALFDALLGAAFPDHDGGPSRSP